MYKYIQGDLHDVVTDLNRHENDDYKLVQIVVLNTGGVVQAILYKKGNKLEATLKELNKHLETNRKPWWKRWLK